MASANRRKESIELGTEATTSRPSKASEKRKQQNRLSQKNYREKQKKRLQALERFAVSAIAPGRSSQPIVHTPNQHSVLNPASPPSINYSNTTEDINDEIHSPWRLSGQELPSALPSNVELQSNDINFLPPESSVGTLLEADWDLNHWSTGQDILLNTETDPLSHNVSTPAQIHLPIMPPDSLSSDQSSNLLTSTSPKTPGPFEYRLQLLAEQFLKTDLEKLSKDTRGAPSNIPIARGHTTTAASHSPQVQSQKLGLTYFPNPYANHLRIQTINLISACKENALHLGICEPTFCSEDSESYFYRPRLTESTHRETLITSIQNAFRGIKYDLRPCRIQITTSHHPYIDCFPFPSVRKKVIELQAHNPPLIDEDELIHDFFTGGMVCWGGCMPARGVSGSGSGAPWDMRSWEAMGWFLEKWACVVGDADGEVWRQTMWWREMRGD
ncbi:hypothetical protein AOQ84DRAFT_435051 [Glonium stellatum]|uniref:BZIP domain-containing protein n=1 Tax=Glonium stellatum TaxID=574774 RepID=A0A8E2FDT9_9PEZI|nr:hypothetical protein AOQ84DRAFT_435051 [Glonium stellatum]